MKPAFKSLRKNYILSRMISALMVVLMITGMTACGVTMGPQATADDTVFSFAGDEISLGEVYLYAKAVIDDYESVYGEDVWNTDISVTRDSSANMEDVTRKDIIENIVHVKMLVSKASEYKAALTEEEVDQVNSETDAFYENLTDDQIAEMQLTRDKVQNVMEENALAKKVYDTIIAEAGIEVSDEDARETTFYDMYFECYAVASSGDVTKFSEDERQTQYQRAVQAYNTLTNPIESGNNDGTSATNAGSTNIEGLAEYYGLHNAAYYTMTPNEIAGMYGDEIEKQMYELEDGSYSLVTEAEYGYHIFYMKALTDRDATDKRKTELIVGKKRSYMETIYSNWLKSMDSSYKYEKSVDFDVYNTIKF